MIEQSFIKLIKKIIFSYNFPSNRYRSYDDSLRNVSLALVNIHFSGGLVRPYVPNMVEIGGIQVKPEPSPLPEVNYKITGKFS
jgi:glucuronosyltransferase